ncbi:APC family permease [Planctomyces sp. SH-PL62]|uniref:APC family permease n=1 Tax=Planctomyces sp. SH-PL62 TaxID=1636152 RepID=UPI00078E937F|nr:amino acid permease [Planctomyces sp. SH-PL62]AMV37175.1 Serine/threonine exchanger SteT [Planctomyces sp. SH-PL62]
MGIAMSPSEDRAEAADFSDSAAGEAKMPAEFGVWMAVSVVVASMVGTGVLTTSGYTMALVGSNRLMLALWLVGGLIAICGALTLAELSAALPKTGGDYVFLFEAYGPLAAFLSGWVSFLMGFSGPSATAAYGSAKYVLAPLRLSGTNAMLAERGLATVAILIFAAIHVSGRRRTSLVQGWITGLKVAVLLVLIVAGLSVGWPNTANLNDARPIDAGLAKTMLFSMVFVYYAYTGWNGASYLAGEIREPQKVLPRAILIGTGIVAVLYLAVNVVYALALSAADVQAIVADPTNTQGLDAVAPIAEIASRRLFGEQWSNPLSVAIGLMMLSSLSVYMLLGPRVIYAMAKAGQFPSIAARLRPGTQTPGVATLFQIAATLVLLWTGSFENLFIYASVGLSMFSLLAMSAIFVLRVKRPDLPRPFRTPGYPVTPAVYLLLTGTLLVAAFVSAPFVSTISLVSMLVGIPIYFLASRSRPAEAA